MLESRWTKRYPHPGKRPARPDEGEQLTAEHQHDWFLRRYYWNAYIQKLRKHEIACALDRLEFLEETGATLSPEQIVARNVAALVLDGTLLATAAELGHLLVRSGQ